MVTYLYIFIHVNIHVDFKPWLHPWIQSYPNHNMITTRLMVIFIQNSTTTMFIKKNNFNHITNDSDCNSTNNQILIVWPWCYQNDWANFDLMANLKSVAKMRKAVVKLSGVTRCQHFPQHQHQQQYQCQQTLPWHLQQPGTSIKS